MSDPLTEIVGLLEPKPAFSKTVLASGSWAVRRSEEGRPFYCAVLAGRCRLAPDGEPAVVLEAGDFVLVPAARDFTASSIDAPSAEGCRPPVEVGPGLFRLGDGAGPPEVRALLGHCALGSHDARLLVSLLPRVVHVRGQGRLLTLVELVDGESRAARPGRDAVLTRLLEVLFIEALRSSAGATAAPPGLLRGLADDRIAAALRHMHGTPRRPWTVVELAREAGLSRSTFFERFAREVGVPPMDYLLTWRMALAKALLRRGGASVGEVAGEVGYSSASTFGVAFARHVGRSPSAFVRQGSSA